MNQKCFKFKKLISVFALVAFCLCFPLSAIASSEQAIFAGGCFWCLEHDLESLKGITSVESGYSGGDLPNPTYRNHTGHQEVVEVTYESNKISFDKLLRGYWRNIDPFDSRGQFCDRGESYKPAIFFMNENQLYEAEVSLEKAAIELSVEKGEIGVGIYPAKTFWVAEDYHQDFAKNNKIKYNFYRKSCGRDKRLDNVWGKNSRTTKEWQS